MNAKERKDTAAARGTARRVIRLIANSLTIRVATAEVVLTGPQASCLTQRYQKPCPESLFSFPVWRVGSGRLAGRSPRRGWRRFGRSQAEPYCRPCRRDGRATPLDW